MAIKVILFDMFDTLMLIEKDHEFYQPALQRAHRYLQNHGVKVAFERFQSVYIEERDKLYAQADAKLEEPHFNLRFAKTLQKLGYNYGDQDPVVAAATCEFGEEFSKYVKVDKNAAATLEALSGKFRLGLVSNFAIPECRAANQFWMRFAIPECVYKLLKAAGIYRYFDVLVVSGAVNKRKPHPQIFQAALEPLGVEAAEAVFVGDTVDADVEGPKAVGMHAIYIERRTQKIEKSLPDKTIKALSELPLAISSLTEN